MLQHIAYFLFQQKEPPKHIIDIFTSKSDIRIAEPYDVQIDELGNHVITMYQFVGDMIQKFVV